MNSLPLCCALLVLGLGLPSAARQSDGAKPPPPPIRDLGAAIRGEIQGAWKLTKFETTKLRSERRDEAGYLLITDGFLSFECHIGWLEVTGSRQASTFFSGTHTFELGQDGTLRTSTLIGSTVDPELYRPIFEPPGRQREYKVGLVNDTLTLTRVADQQRFTFTRLARSEGLDFYGRKKKPAAPPAEGEGGKREDADGEPR